MIESNAHRRCLHAFAALRRAETQLRLAASGAVAGESERAGTRLRSEQAALRTALRDVPELLLELSSESRCADPCGLADETAAEPGTWHVSDIFPCDAADVILAALREAANEGLSIGKQARVEMEPECVSLAVSVFRRCRDGSRTPSFLLALRDTGACGQLPATRAATAAFFELSREPMCVADHLGKFQQVNQAFADLTGFSCDELLSRPFLDFVVPEDRDKTASEVRRQIAVGASREFENRYRCKDGRVVTLSWTAHYDSRERITYATARDITDRKQKEEEYTRLIQASLDGFWVSDFSGRIVEVNDAVCRMLGYSREELLRLSIFDVEARASRAEIIALATQMLCAGSLLFQGHHRRKDGTILDVEISVVVGGPGNERFFTFIRDITDRKRAEASLQEAHRLLQDVEKLSKLGGWRYDCAAARMVWTDEVYRICGVDRSFDPDDLPRLAEFFEDGEHAARAVDTFGRAVSGGEPYDLELRMTRADGEPIWVRVTGNPRIENGAVVSVIGYIVDITENKRIREALRESEQRLSTIFQTEPECVKVLARDGTLLEMNATGLAMLGLRAPSEIRGRTLVDFVVPEHRDGFLALHERVMQGESGILEFEIEGTGGVRRWVETHAAPMRDATGKITMSLGISRDITERRKADEERRLIEAQLRESQKMEALGTLAGGIAHDFNNIIFSVMGNVELAERDVGPDHPARESLEEIAKASRRAKSLVQQILAFGRRQVFSRELMSLDAVVEETGRLLRTTLPAGVALQIECAADTPAVLADATQVEQIILNLCNNAWYAVKDLPSPGMIEVRLDAHERTLAESQTSGTNPAYGDVKPGRYACLTVRDNGCGMDPATLARIFEPFFTTKPRGEGSGLGLAVVHGIVHEHGASLEVRSAPAQGSSFRVYFPAVDRSPSPVSEQTLQPRSSTWGRGRHLLFIDDDEAIVFLMKRLLEREGYHVSAYTDPSEAIEAARAAPDRFDLAVTDYNMPVMSGLDVTRQLRAISGDLPVALASGYVTEELREAAMAAGVSELICKPNTVDEFCAAIARLNRTRRD